MAIGIYSGTFDPVHEGHVLFAQVACEQFGLDTILFMAEPKPRFKTGVSTLDDRTAMLELALKDSSNMKNYEIRGLESHTINGVIRQVASDFPDEEYFILMGADVFEGISKWGVRDDEDGSASDIASSVGFIVGLEDVTKSSAINQEAKQLGLNARLIEVPLKGLSSRSIRESVKAGLAPKGLNDDVKAYINTVKLYS